MGLLLYDLGCSYYPLTLSNLVGSFSNHRLLRIFLAPRLPAGGGIASLAAAFKILR